MHISELGKSSFRHDGYKDAINGFPPSPPNHFVFEAEYNQGYGVGLADLKRMQESN
jgi:hypothetical protein